MAEVGEFFDYLTVALLPVLLRTPLPRVRRFRRGIDRARAGDGARDRGAPLAPRAMANGDLLSILLAARDVEGDGTGMSDDQVRDEALTLITAGHETTGERPQLDVVHAGAAPRRRGAASTPSSTRCSAAARPSAGDAAALVYTEAVLLESMRLYPPAWGIERRALRRPGDRRLRHPRRRRGADADVS